MDRTQLMDWVMMDLLTRFEPGAIPAPGTRTMGHRYRVLVEFGPDDWRLAEFRQRGGPAERPMVQWERWVPAESS